MEKELKLNMVVDMDGFLLSTNSFSNSVDVILSSLPNVNIDISNVSYSLLSISWLEKVKKRRRKQ